MRPPDAARLLRASSGGDAVRTQLKHWPRGLGAEEFVPGGAVSGGAATVLEARHRTESEMIVSLRRILLGLCLGAFAAAMLPAPGLAASGSPQNAAVPKIRGAAVQGATLRATRG